MNRYCYNECVDWVREQSPQSPSDPGGKAKIEQEDGDFDDIADNNVTKFTKQDELGSCCQLLRLREYAEWVTDDSRWWFDGSAYFFSLNTLLWRQLVSVFVEVKYKNCCVLSAMRRYRTRRYNYPPTRQPASIPHDMTLEVSDELFTTSVLLTVAMAISASSGHNLFNRTRWVHNRAQVADVAKTQNTTQSEIASTSRGKSPLFSWPREGPNAGGVSIESWDHAWKAMLNERGV